MESRTIGAIALRPTGNAQGGYYFISLTSGWRLSRSRWTTLPMPQEVIDRVHVLARQSNANHDLTFAWRDGSAIADVHDDDDNSDYDPEELDSDAESEAVDNELTDEEIDPLTAGVIESESEDDKAKPATAEDKAKPATAEFEQGEPETAEFPIEQDEEQNESGAEFPIEQEEEPEREHETTGVDDDVLDGHKTTGVDGNVEENNEERESTGVDNNDELESEDDKAKDNKAREMNDRYMDQGQVHRSFVKGGSPTRNIAPRYGHRTTVGFM
jgi:hypothetical protein